MDHVDFEFQGVFYTVPIRALEADMIVLPNGHILHVAGWLTFDEPNKCPQPYGVQEIFPVLSAETLTPEQKAQELNAVLAEQKLEARC